ncbi:MAG: Lrp/AsnC family transcriptional regulator [Desulfobacterales bacterium]
MRPMLNDIEKKVVSAIQGDIPVASQPYRELASRIGIEEDQFLSVLSDLCKRGYIRRFGATLKHQKSGYTSNAMGAWKVEEERVEVVGSLMASHRQISHCYRRDPAPDWPYNLYTMIHADSEASCRRIAEDLSMRSGVRQYALFFSRRELKKTSMAYFSDDDED